LNSAVKIFIPDGEVCGIGAYFRQRATSFLIGVAFSNLVRDVPIDSDMNYIGGFFTLLNPYTLLAGIAVMVTFTFYGAIFLSLKTRGALKEKVYNMAKRLWLSVVIVFLFLLVATFYATDILSHVGVSPGIVPLVSIVSIFLSGYFIRKNWIGWAFFTTALSIVFALITMFMILYPRVLVSNPVPANSLTIYNASSTPCTLTIMTIVAVIFCAGSFDLPGLELLDFPQTIDRRFASGIPKACLDTQVNSLVKKTVAH